MESKVDIGQELYSWIEKRLEKTDFETVEDYVRYVLENVRKEVDEEDDSEDSPMSSEDEEKVKERLRALGYLD